MCGIVGYIGYRPAQPILLRGLEQLEYRGYDSCGISLHTGDMLEVHKEVGLVANLRDRVGDSSSTRGIGHTRWSTVGKPTQNNAHPFLDCRESVAVVHNGVIENYEEIRNRLIDQGHAFTSDTDSEVLVHLIESNIRKGPAGSVIQSLSEIEGTYAIAAMFQSDEQLVLARKESPVVIGVGKGETFVASDVSALIEHTTKVLNLEDADVAIVSADDVQVIHDGNPVKRKFHQINWTMEQASKAGYDDFFLKELHETPRVVRDALAKTVTSEMLSTNMYPDLEGAELPRDINFIGSGTASYAGQIGASIFSELSDRRVSSFVASELNALMNNEDTWSVLLSQSGETADTLNAAKKTRLMGHFTIGITNTPDSELTKLVDSTILTLAGPEQSVASSKTFIAQLIELYLLGLHLFPPPLNQLHEMLLELRQMPAKIHAIFERDTRVRQVASYLADREHLYVIGNGINYPVALEGALKFKELAYLHAEAYPSGELKHGPFALLTGDTPVIVLVPQGTTYQNVINSVREISARGAPVIAIAETDEGITSLSDEFIRVPATMPFLSPILNTVVLHLLAYHCAKLRGNPIDRPRNLAKSVTVP